MLSIDILIPTRDRPDSIKAVMESALGSAANPKSINFCFYADDDDEASLDAMEAVKPWAAEQFGEAQFLCGARESLVPIYNRMSGYTNGDIIMYAADDIEFVTPGWDDSVRAAFEEVADRTVLVWAHDPAREVPFPDHGFVSRWSKNCLRYLFIVFPPHPDYPDSPGIAMTDVWLHALYFELERLKYLPDIEIRHKHWRTNAVANGNTKMDDSYAVSSVLTTWRATPEFVIRMKQVPLHAKYLTKWIEWVAADGLERVGYDPDTKTIQVKVPDVPDD